MIEDQASETAVAAARLRAAHQVLDAEPLVLNDPVSIGLVPDSSEIELRAKAEIFDSRFMRILRAGFVARSRIAEDALARAVDEAATQLVLIGAGFDTFPYRQPDWARSLRIFEVDHPATQNAKRELLEARLAIPPENLTFCPVDFESDDLRSALAGAGLDATDRTFFTWLGVVPYLTRAAIEATLTSIRRCAGRGAVVFSYVPSDQSLASDDAEVVRIASAASANRGEPWLTRFEPESLETLLASLDYPEIEHHDPSELAAFFAPERPDGLPIPGFESLVVASWS